MRPSANCCVLSDVCRRMSLDFAFSFIGNNKETCDASGLKAMSTGCMPSSRLMLAATIWGNDFGTARRPSAGHFSTSKLAVSLGPNLTTPHDVENPISASTVEKQSNQQAQAKT